MNISILKAVSKSTTLLFSFAIISISSVLGASSSNAESFVVDGNKALNTNNSFSKIYGQPRMSVWDFNPNDPDQQFTIDPNPHKLGGSRLIHRSTGKCLNAYLPKNGSDVNVWGCSETDPDQRFDISSVGNGYFQIQRRGTTLCLDNPVPRANGGRVILWECDRTNTNVNQRWKNSSAVVNPPQSDRLTRINRVLDQFINAYSITDPNGNYPGQCVSFVKRFTQSLGIWMNPMGGNGGARYGFINYNVAGLSLTANQADKIVFNGSQQPQVGDIIFFDKTSANAYGHIAVVQSVLGNGRVIIQESNANAKAPNTSVTRGEINLNSNPPKAAYGNVLGWLRLKI